MVERRGTAQDPEEQVPSLSSACPLRDARRQSFCPNEDCRILELLSRCYGIETLKAIRVHRRNTGVLVAARAFAGNACRTTLWRRDTHMSHGSTFLKGLENEELYLVTAMADRDNQAWSVFLDRYRAVVFKTCRRMGLSPSETEEAAADLNYDLLVRNSLARFHATGPLEVWLRRCIQISALRTIERHKRSLGRLPPNCVAKMPGPLDRVIRVEEETLLRSALQRIPTSERRAVELRYYGDGTFAMIASRLGRKFPAQSARIVLRGVRHLRRVIDTTGRDGVSDRS